jgi:peptidoglycan/xylan/chitin deacetylase (PgdA/CDA1 family)
MTDEMIQLSRPNRRRKWKATVHNMVEKLGVMTLFQKSGHFLGEVLYVLAYHRVDEFAHRPYLEPTLISAEPAQFENQMRLIAQRYHPVSAEEVLAALHGHRRLPKDAVLVTVDDGYRDFKEVLYPITQRYNIRPVLFVPTAFVGQGVFWWDQLYIAICNCPHQEISTQFGAFSLRTPEEKQQALERLRQAVKTLPFDQGMQFVASLYAQFAPRDFDPTPCTLNWDELRELSAAGATIAAHTHHHVLLTRIPFEQACQEIRTSQELIRREIGQALPIFAFPDGKPEFISAELINFLRQEGIEFAVSTIEGSATLSAGNALCFPRLGLWPNHSLAAFHFHLTPVYRFFKREHSVY